MNNELKFGLQIPEFGREPKRKSWQELLKEDTHKNLCEYLAMVINEERNKQ